MKQQTTKELKTEKEYKEKISISEYKNNSNNVIITKNQYETDF
jgi:hypothetical protein